MERVIWFHAKSLRHTLLMLVLSAGLLSAQIAAAQNTTSTNRPSQAGDASPPEQPIPFSHKKHCVFLACSVCHQNADPGVDMTIPAASKCMSCHSEASKSAALQKLVTFAKGGQAIPWVRVYSVPNFVFWSHRTHLDASIKCEACHGQVAEMNLMVRSTNVTTMKGCVECHKKLSAPTFCATCHETSTP